MDQFIVCVVNSTHFQWYGNTAKYFSVHNFKLFRDKTTLCQFNVNLVSHNGTHWWSSNNILLHIWIRISSYSKFEFVASAF